MKPMHIYSDNIEQGALDQFYSAMAQDYAVAGALMPDAHLGYGLPIGGVVETVNNIVPAWVGYDIGCGVLAVKLSCTKDSILLGRESIMDAIYDAVPTGFNIHQKPQPQALTMLSFKALTDPCADIAKDKKWQRALGTLGGGNHFIEIGYGDDGYVWLSIHSGSRGVGWNIAAHHMKVADKLNVDGLAHAPLDTNSRQGKDYINDMNWALEYALLNRQCIASLVLQVLSRHAGKKVTFADKPINRNHNHAVLRMQMWGDKGIDQYWIHRKGATHAENDMLGAIPANSAEGVFIVRGKGNPDSLMSSSHGAGRVLGRRAAKRELSMDTYREQMKDVTARVTESRLDEAPLAYKNIHEVMQNQQDLIDVVAHVKPLISVKG